MCHRIPKSANEKSTNVPCILSIYAPYESIYVEQQNKKKNNKTYNRIKTKLLYNTDTVEFHDLWELFKAEGCKLVHKYARCEVK